MAQRTHTTIAQSLVLAAAFAAVSCGGSAGGETTGEVGEAVARAEGRECPSGLRGPINLPADDAVHPYSPYSDEWWYYSSHLETDDGRKFGFAQIVYTLVDPQASPIQYVDSTVTDVAAGSYHFGGRQYDFAPATVLPDAFAFQIGTERVQGGNGHDIVHSEISDASSRYVIDLKLESDKTPVLHLADGFINYYSRERMKATGTVSVNGTVHRVVGHTWFDHQFGPQLVELATVQNWTWIAMQLSRGREILALVVNKQDGTQLIIGWTVSPTCTYPFGWEVTVPSKGVDVFVQPLVQNQDILVPGIDHYYEWDSRVTGSDRGQAYVELFGFCAP
jgi:predicted secreted hydrolase